MATELEVLSKRVIEIGTLCQTEQPKLERLLTERSLAFSQAYREHGPGIEWPNFDPQPANPSFCITWYVSFSQAQSLREQALESLMTLLEEIWQEKLVDPTRDWQYRFEEIIQSVIRYCASVFSLRQCVEAEDSDLLLLREHDPMADSLFCQIQQHYADFNAAVKALEDHEQATGLRADWRVKYSFIPPTATAVSPISTDDPTVELRGDVLNKYGYSTFSEYCRVTKQKLPRHGPRVRSLTRRAVAVVSVIAAHVKLLQQFIQHGLPFAVGAPRFDRSSSPTFRDCLRIANTLHHLDPLTFSWGDAVSAVDEDGGNGDQDETPQSLHPFLPDQLFIDPYDEQDKVVAFSSFTTLAAHPPSRPSPLAQSLFDRLASLLSPSDLAQFSHLFTGDHLNRVILTLFAFNSHLPLFGFLSPSLSAFALSSSHQRLALQATLDLFRTSSLWPSSHPLHGTFLFSSSASPSSSSSLAPPSDPLSSSSRSYWLTSFGALVLILRTSLSLSRLLPSSSDHVIALWSDNRPEWYLLDIATALLGGLLPSSYTTTAAHHSLPASAVASLLASTAPQLLATTLSCLCTEADLRLLLDALPSLSVILLLDSPPVLPAFLAAAPVSVVCFYSLDWVGTDFAAALAHPTDVLPSLFPSPLRDAATSSPSSSSPLSPDFSPDKPVSFAVPDPAPSEMTAFFTLMFSSGSTQVPKAIAISRRQWCHDLLDVSNNRYLSPIVNVSFLSSAWATDRDGVWRVFSRFGATGFPATPSPMLLSLASLPSHLSPSSCSASSSSSHQSLEVALHAFQVFRPTLLSAPPVVWEFLLQQLQQQHPIPLDSDLWHHPDLIDDVVDQPVPLFRLTKQDVRTVNAFRRLLGGRCITCGSGGASMSSQSEALLRRLLWPDNFSISYGATEIGGVLQDGKVLPGIEVKLSSVPHLGFLISDQPYPRGELYARSLVSRQTSFLSGYLKSDQLTSCYDPDGWYRTSDLFMYLPQRRRYVFLGRTNDQFKTARGEWVVPLEIEKLLASHSSARISNCLVSGSSEFLSPHILLDLPDDDDPPLDPDRFVLCSVSARGVWLVPHEPQHPCVHLPPTSALHQALQRHYRTCRQVFFSALQSAQIPDVFSIALRAHPWSPANKFLLPSFKVNRLHVGQSLAAAIHRTQAYHESLVATDRHEEENLQEHFDTATLSFEQYQALLDRAQQASSETDDHGMSVLRRWIGHQAAQLLGTSAVDVEASFGELGGSSVSAVACRMKLQREIDTLFRTLPAATHGTHAIVLPEVMELLRLPLSQIAKNISHKTHRLSLNLLIELLSIHHLVEDDHDHNPSLYHHTVSASVGSPNTDATKKSDPSSLLPPAAADAPSVDTPQVSEDEVAFLADQQIDLPSKFLDRYCSGGLLAARPSRDSFGSDLLLFGASGFVGSAIVARFIEHPGSGDLIAVVRGKTGLDAAQRLLQILQENATPLVPTMQNHSSQIVQLCSRIWVVAGDLTEPNFGWSDLTEQWVTSRTACIINSAVQMNFCQGYRAHKPVNVDPLPSLVVLSLKLNTPHPRLLHLSTLSVFGTATVCRENAAVPVETLQRADGYSRSKWVAERLLQQAARALAELAAPVTLSVIRLGLIGYHQSTGIGCLRDWPSRLLRAILALRMAPIPHKEAGFAFVACNGAADVILKEANVLPVPSQSNNLRILHVTNKHLSMAGCIRFALLWDILILHGYLDSIVEWPVWESNLVSAGVDDSPNSIFTAQQRTRCQELVPLLPFFRGILPLPGPYASTVVSYRDLPPIELESLLNYIQWLQK